MTRPTVRSKHSLNALVLASAFAFSTTNAAHAASNSAPSPRASARASVAHAKARHANGGTLKARKSKKKTGAKVDYTGEFVNFVQWKEVDAFLDQMVRQHGFARAELDALIGQVRLVDAAVQLIKPAPPGKPKNWQAYQARFIEPVRINAGVAFWNANADTLARAETQYGVPAEIIVGILGVETLYGRDTGRFRVLDALTTLAFAYPETPSRVARMDFFRGQLEHTLLLARETHIDPLSLLGSFAGAVGVPQFMPGSIRKYGVDFDADGKIDLHESNADTIGSVANFLVAHGWRRTEPGPLVIPATVAMNRAWEAFIGQGLTARYTTEQLQARGVTVAAAPPVGMLFGLVDLQNGADPSDYYLGTNNFFAITAYNRSFFYAMSVIELGQAVHATRSR